MWKYILGITYEYLNILTSVWYGGNNEESQSGAVGLSLSRMERSLILKDN